MMHRMKGLKECLVDIVEEQLYCNRDKVCTKELGETIDMIKDLSEAMYYHAITEAMEEGSEVEEHHMEMPYKEHHHKEEHHEVKDHMMGKSAEHRKMYMEGKGTKDRTWQMKELENYAQELTSDIIEMIQDSTMEEKQMLQQKIATLATKIK